MLPADLKFRFSLNKQLLGTITIKNPHKQRLAYKIKTTGGASAVRCRYEQHDMDHHHVS